MSNSLRPNLVVLTVDYIWREQAEAAFESFPSWRGRNARHGVHSVLGNHDFWLDVEVTKQYLQKQAFRVDLSGVRGERR